MDLLILLGIDHVLAGGIFVAIEMSLGFISILLNVIILATIRNSDALQKEEQYILMGNMSAANIMTGSFVKLMSVVLCGHAVAVDNTEVEFQFCSLFVFSHRMSWSILPSTVFIMYWVDLMGKIKQYIILKQLDNDFETSSVGKTSNFEEEGDLTKLYMIRKTNKYITLLKVFTFMTFSIAKLSSSSSLTDLGCSLVLFLNPPTTPPDRKSSFQAGRQRNLYSNNF